MKKKFSVWAWLGIIVGGFVCLNFIAFFLFKITIIPLHADNAASNSKITTTALQQTKSSNASLALRELKDDELIAAVKKDNKCGFIDTNGKFVIEPTFNEACDFSEGYALVQLGDKAGLIDKTGKIIVDLGQAVDDTNFETDQKTGEHYYNKSGIEVGSQSCFYEGLMPILYRTDGKFQGYYRYIDTKGNTILDGYTSAEEFKNGIALVATSVDESGWACDYSYIDKNGKYLFDKKFKLAYAFSEGLACVQGDNGLYGYINIKGDWVIEPQFKYSGSEFSNGYALVFDSSTVSTTDHWQFINNKGQPVFGDKHFKQFDACADFSTFHDGVACVMTSDSRPQYIDSNGNTIFEMPSTYKYYPVAVFPMINGFAFIKLDDKTDIVINNKGDVILKGINKLPLGSGFSYINKPEEKKEYPVVSPSNSSEKKSPTESAPKTLSMEWYNKTHNGMTYNEVCQITGCPGQEIMSTQYQAMYRWYGNSGDYLTLEFFNGKLINHDSIINNATNDSSQTQSTVWSSQVKSGMTYDEVCQITGSKGECIISTQHLTMYRWSGNSDDYLNLEFVKGKLASGYFGVKDMPISKADIHITELYTANQKDKYKNDPLASTFWREYTGTCSEKSFLSDWFLNRKNVTLWFLPNGTGILFENNGEQVNPNKPNIKWQALGEENDEYKYSITFEDGSKYKAKLYGSTWNKCFDFQIGGEDKDANIFFRVCNIVKFNNKQKI